MYLIKYRRNSNNEVFYNLNKHLYDYHYVGKTTTNNWTIINIYVLYNEKFIPLNDYKNMIIENKRKERATFKNKFRRIMNILKERRWNDECNRCPISINNTY